MASRRSSTKQPPGGKAAGGTPERAKPAKRPRNEEARPTVDARAELRIREWREGVAVVLCRRAADHDVHRDGVPISVHFVSRNVGNTDWIDESLNRLVVLEGFPADDEPHFSWLAWLARHGVAATTHAVADLIAGGWPLPPGSNILSAIGVATSVAVRRAALLAQLRQSNWNLAHAASALGMGYGSAPVLREIRRLGLVPEYEAAKRDGKVARGGRRERLPGTK